MKGRINIAVGVKEKKKHFRYCFRMAYWHISRTLQHNMNVKRSNWLKGKLLFTACWVWAIVASCPITAVNLCRGVSFLLQFRWLPQAFLSFLKWLLTFIGWFSFVCVASERMFSFLNIYWDIVVRKWLKVDVC